MYFQWVDPRTNKQWIALSEFKSALLIDESHHEWASYEQWLNEGNEPLEWLGL